MIISSHHSKIISCKNLSSCNINNKDTPSNKLKGLSLLNFCGKKINRKGVKNIDLSTTDYFNYAINCILENPSGLNSKELIKIKSKLKEVEDKLNVLEELKLQLGRILDYDKYRKAGVEASDILRYQEEDDIALKKAETFAEKNAKFREHMFGYPTNMGKDSAVMQRLREMEASLPLINECGDSYEIGNYSMDAKVDYEQPILRKIYKHLGLKPPKIKIIETTNSDGSIQKEIKYKGPWGYITPGGSESNRWGISNGLRKYPNAIVYFSKAAHYSVSKVVKMNVLYNGKTEALNYINSEPVSTMSNSEKIDTDELISKIEDNWKLNKAPAVILLTWGTTKTGAVDDVEEISRRLNNLGVEHYIHLDAAMYGGIAKNQINAPTLPNIKSLDVDSISISLHKYFGSNGVNSIVISKEKPIGEYVDYIGITDSTTSGSRTFNPFSTLQHVVETLERKLPDDYSKNVLYFDKLLTQNKVVYSREKNSNTFIIDKPCDKICKKYQLSVFKDNDGKDKAHIIIFPYHKENVMKKLASDLSN